MVAVGVLAHQAPLSPYGNAEFWLVSPNLFLVKAGSVLVMLAGAIGLTRGGDADCRVSSPCSRANRSPSTCCTWSCCTARSGAGDSYTSSARALGLGEVLVSASLLITARCFCSRGDGTSFKRWRPSCGRHAPTGARNGPLLRHRLTVRPVGDHAPAARRAPVARARAGGHSPRTGSRSRRAASPLSNGCPYPALVEGEPCELGPRSLRLALISACVLIAAAPAAGAEGKRSRHVHGQGPDDGPDARDRRSLRPIPGAPPNTRSSSSAATFRLRRGTSADRRSTTARAAGALRAVRVEWREGFRLVDRHSLPP